MTTALARRPAGAGRESRGLPRTPCLPSLGLGPGPSPVPPASCGGTSNRRKWSHHLMWRDQHFPPRLLRGAGVARLAPTACSPSIPVGGSAPRAHFRVRSSEREEAQTQQPRGERPGFGAGASTGAVEPAGSCAGAASWAAAWCTAIDARSPWQNSGAQVFQHLVDVNIPQTPLFNLPGRRGSPATEPVGHELLNIRTNFGVCREILEQACGLC